MLESNSNRDKDKLVPLRKFAVPGIYSAAYLSQLVQRGKLRAKRIGRNYFTSENWFNEYLERHARDEKQAKYFKYLKNLKPSETAPYCLGAAPVKKLNIKTLAITMAFFVVLIILNLVYIFEYKDKGQIAGVEESVVASSTVDMDK